MKYGIDNEINLKLLVVLNRCQQSIMKKGHESIKESNLTTPQFAVLEMLYHKGSLKVGEIIDKSLSTIGSISVVIDNLIKSGLVKKEKCSEDKRITYVAITPKGRELMAGIFPNHLKDIEKVMDKLSREEKEILIMLLKKLGKS